MEIRNWAILLFSLILLFLIFNFLRTIFKTEKKGFAQERLYVDYSNYKKISTPASDKNYGYYSPIMTQQVDLAQKYIHAGRMDFAVRSYETGMANAFANAPDPDSEKAAKSGAFDKYMSLSAKPIDGLTQARILFARKNFREALEEYSGLVKNIDKEDYQHLMQIYDSMAECCFNLKEKDGYVENKVNYIHALRQIRELVQKAYPGRPEQKIQDWLSSEEATQQLLRLRSMAEQRIQGPEKELIIRRAEYDLEVSRRLSQ